MGSGWGFKSGGGGGGGGGGNKTNYTQNKFPPKKDRQPPKQPQIHYCEVCKISCAGPQVGIEKENSSAIGNSGLELHRGCDLCCPGLGLGAPSKVSN